MTDPMVTPEPDTTTCSTCNQPHLCASHHGAHPSCTGHTRRGTPCPRHRYPGATICDLHGAKAPQTKAAADRRVAVAEAVDMAERMLGRMGVDADPIEHLLECLHRSAMLTHVYATMVADLDEEDRLTVSSKRGVDVHPFVKEYHAALERTAKFAKLCLDAGVQERQVRLAERTGEMIVQVLDAALKEIGLTGSQLEDARRAVGREFRRLELTA